MFSIKSKELGFMLESQTLKETRKILVVDDEVHILHVVALKLKNAGYNVITAQDGIEALEKAQSECPDLMITDYQMPHLSGIELCQKLKHFPGTRELPCILLTARGFNLDESLLENAGIKLCMSKPFSPREVLEVVDELLVESLI